METKSINPAVFHVFSYAVRLFFLDSAALRPITNFFFANKGSYKLKKDKNIFVQFGFVGGTLFSRFCSIGFKSGLLYFRKVDFLYGYISSKVVESVHIKTTGYWRNIYCGFRINNEHGHGYSRCFVDSRGRKTDVIGFDSRKGAFALRPDSLFVRGHRWNGCAS
jgi:hypothetical protein